MEMNSANVEAVVKQVLESMLEKKVRKKQLRHRKQQEMKFQRQLM